MAGHTLLVKKYGNRRLYDTEASRYITLEELAQLIRSGRDVKIIDAKSKTDLTKAVLLQIISEQEKEQDLLPVSFLKKMIQLGDESMREALPRYLSFSLDAFFAAQKQFERRYQNLAGSFLNPMMWLAPAMAPGVQGPRGEPDGEGLEPSPEEAASSPEAGHPPADSAEKDQIQALKAQVEKIQALLAKLSPEE